MKRRKIKEYKNRDTLMTRYGLSFVIMVGLFALFTVLQFIFMDDIFAYVVRRNMYEASLKIEQLDYNSESFMKDVSDIEANYDLYIEIYYPREKLIYSSSINKVVFDGKQTSPSDVKGELKPRIMKTVRHVDLSEKDYLEIRQEYFATAKYLVFGTFYGDNAGIETYSSLDVIKSNARTASWALLWLSLALLIFILVVFLAYTYTFTVPLRKLNKVTKKIGNLDFKEVCPPFRIRELGELSSSVNALSSSLNMTMMDLQKKNERLEQEIERERKLEESRNQFIANASHELKTPIAIIQGYAEGIRYSETKEDSEEYCDVIIEEAQKMNRLVVRMLEMMRFENNGYTAKKEKLPLRRTVWSCIASRKRHLDDNGIRLELSINESYVGFGDRELFERVFNNYFSNALSHIEGEKLLKISCEVVNDYYRISVFNSGKPIDDEDIEHIWTSFYRADKSRSREQGRFGLGLAIVADAQTLQNAKYGVVNHLDGVEFWFDVLICNE